LNIDLVVPSSSSPLAEYPMAKVASRKTVPKAKPKPADTPHLEIKIWLRLLACANRIETTMQRKIASTFGISLARFDLLAQLERAGGVLTMTGASKRMMVTNGAVTGLVDRLAQEGFVMRESHPKDRRTILVRLTDEGRHKFLEMAREHESWTISLLAGLALEEKKQLLTNLGALKRRLDAVEPA
jgi:DNA-binding MarR family transcriptional regulator